MSAIFGKASDLADKEQERRASVERSEETSADPIASPSSEENSSEKSVQRLVDGFATPYFTINELKCKGTGEYNCDPIFLCFLTVLRHKFGKPLIINSCCRSPEHNAKVGGNANSLHLTKGSKYGDGTRACDISTRGWSEADKTKFLDLAKSEGWNIGVANTYFHIDRGQDVGISKRIWKY